MPEPVMKVLSTQSLLPYAFETMFEPHPQSEMRKRSAFTLIKCLLAKKNKPEVLSAHYRELLSVLLWKITEADGKHNTRFKSQRALRCRDKGKLRHDHVCQRSKMIAALEKAAPRKVDKILRTAIGCTVTKKEHRRLSKFDKKYDSWKRYQKAGIKVIDTQTNKRVKLSRYRNSRKRNTTELHKPK